MKRKYKKQRHWNYNLIINQIKKNGYFVYENFFHQKI